MNVVVLLGFKVISFLLFFVVLSGSASIADIKKIFGTDFCIVGSLSTIATKEVEIIKDAAISFNNFSVADSVKSSMSELKELAEFNEIAYLYKLIKEEGPSHNKLYLVSLTLGDEEFTSEGTSLKKAQQNVAALALKNTLYEKPPIKEKYEINDKTTPTVLLNNLCAKLAIGVEYFLVNKVILDTNGIDNTKLKKSYLQKLNESIYSEIHIKQEEGQMKGPFKIAVQVGEIFFYGTSHTIQSARHEAASKAIDHLIKTVQDGNTVCLQEGSEDECKQAKASLKSPISAVYEAAQLRNLHVEFDIIGESGPSHKKTFVTKCTLGQLSTTGEGKSKKESKRLAAINMLEMVSELPEVSQEAQVANMIKNKNRTKKNKKNKILKTNFDVINRHVSNFLSSIKEFSFQDDQNSQTSANSKPGKQKHLKKSFQDGFLELSNILKFEVQFTDFNQENDFYTLMSFHINPEHICLGEGSSLNMARNKAAREGLTLLHHFDLGNHLKNKKLTFMESEIRQKINILLNEEISDF